MEQRRARRFDLKLPVSVLRAGGKRVSQAGETCNISSAGVLFLSKHELQAGGPIEYLITLNNQAAPRVNLRCMGKVVRSENIAQEAFQVAATLERYEFVRAELQ